MLSDPAAGELRADADEGGFAAESGLGRVQTEAATPALATAGVGAVTLAARWRRRGVRNVSPSLLNLTESDHDVSHSADLPKPSVAASCWQLLHTHNNLTTVKVFA